MRKRYVIEVDWDEKGKWFTAWYPMGNNNARKMCGEPMIRRVHIYKEQKKAMVAMKKKRDANHE